MSQPRWVHASLTVIVPATPKPIHVAPAAAQLWNLEHLFETGHTVPNPNEVAWDPISDKRIERALHPTQSVAYFPARGSGSHRRDGDALLAQMSAAADWTLASDSPLRQRSAPLPDGVTVRAVEVLYLPNGDPATTPAPAAAPAPAAVSAPAAATASEPPDVFVVLHLLLSGLALEDPGRVAAYFAHPAEGTSERTGHHEGPAGGYPLLVMNKAQWTKLLDTLGFAPFGPTSGWRVWHPFVISHLVPAETTPPAPFNSAPSLAHWDNTRLWAWRMTGGRRLSHTWEPGRGAADPDRDGTWIGSTWCRATENGLAFVATRGSKEPGTLYEREGAAWWRKGFENVEHVRIAGLAHRNAALLAVLSLRQSERLQRHAEALATDVRWPEPPENPENDEDPTSASMVEYLRSAKATSDVALGLELSLLRFRNRLWFTQLPGRTEETRILQLLQSAAGTPELLADIETEQQQVARGLEAQAVRVRRVHDERVAVDKAKRSKVDAEKAKYDAEVAAKEDQKRAEDERRLNNTLGALSAFVSLFFVFDLVLAITQVKQGGGWDDVRDALLLALPVAVILGVAVVLRIKRKW